MIHEINTKEDVILFSRMLVAEGVNFHPDEDFRNYVNAYSGARTYSDDEAAARNRLMKRSFDVCENLGVDLYDLTMEIFLMETGLSAIIPLPPKE